MFRLVGVQKPHFFFFFFFFKIFGRTRTAYQRFPLEDLKDKVTELQTKEKRSGNKMRNFLLNCVENRRRGRKTTCLSPALFYTSSFISTMEAIHPSQPPPFPPQDWTRLTCRAFSSTLCRRQTSATTITPSPARSLSSPLGTSEPFDSPRSFSPS